MYCSGLQSAKKKRKKEKRKKPGSGLVRHPASCMQGIFISPSHISLFGPQWLTCFSFFSFFLFFNLLRLMIVVPLTQPPLTYEGHTASLRLFHADKQWEKWCLLQHLQAGVVNSAAWKYCSRLIPQITYIPKVSMQYKRSEPWYWWCTQKPGTQDQLKGQTS